jgi:hypothetical protein
MLISGCFIITNTDSLSVLHAASEVNISALETWREFLFLPSKRSVVDVDLILVGLIMVYRCPISLKP